MKGSPIYLDYQATTPVDPRVIDFMQPYWEQHFGNPHSKNHSYGWEARDAVDIARAEIANLLNADDEQIIFTSGATESCNLAIRGVAAANKKKHKLVTLITEHAAVYETVLSLGKNGYEAVILPVDQDGLVNLEQLENTVDAETLLVSIMAVNNEIGTIQPLEEIAQICHEGGAIFHCDATQAIGRIEMDVERLGIDLLSFSGHKIYGPKGVGVLYVSDNPKLKLQPLMTGGGQERGLRSGTLPVPLIAGLGEACRILAEELHREVQRIRHLSEKLRNGLLRTCPDMIIFGHPTQRIYENLTVGFPDYSADEVVSKIANHVSVATGSACSSVKHEPSRVLKALGHSPDIALKGIRLSLGKFTSEEEVDQTLDIIHNYL